MDANLHINMVGIDHNKASIEYRELFSLTKAGAVDAMRILKERYPINGCVILSTCNRTELWISSESNLSPYRMLCTLKEIDAGRSEPSVEWRREFSLMLGLERLLDWCHVHGPAPTPVSTLAAVPDIAADVS